MTLTDKEKIKLAVRVIDEIMSWYPDEEAPHILHQKTTFTVKDLERIKKILES